MISTVNIQHLESVNDVVEASPASSSSETMPDEVVRPADQVELVDQTPEALRRRMAHGNIYTPEKVDAALANYFRPGNLGALAGARAAVGRRQGRRGLQEYREDHGIPAAWETRERVVVAITGAPGGEDADPARGAAWRCAHGRPARRARAAGEGLAGPSTGRLAERRRLLRSSAARTTRSSAATSPRRWWSSPGPRTRRSSSWVRAGARAGASSCAARSSTGWSASSGPSTCTSSRPSTARARAGTGRRAAGRRTYLPRRRQQVGWLAGGRRPAAAHAAILSDRRQAFGLPSDLLLYLAARRRRRRDRRDVCGRCRRGRRFAARSTGTHTADPHLDDRRRRERARAWWCSSSSPAS